MKLLKIVSVILLATLIGFVGYWVGKSYKSEDTGEFTADSGERKIKYWVAPMDPTYVRNEPGKSPMGMDLIPVYEEEEKKERKIKYWVAPMDPTYVRNEPGKSPMGMDLIPVYDDEEENAGSNENAIRIDPAVVQNLGVRTAVVKKRPLLKEIRTVGLVDYDETKYAHIHSKVQGWVEELYIDYTGQYVRKGEPLLAIYSPELVSTQEEYLTAIRGERRDASQGRISGTGSTALVSSTRQRLEYWDISPEQIDALERTGKVTKLMKLFSPFNGIVVKKTALTGMDVMRGKALYEIADLSVVWVYADVYEYELPWLEEGQDVVMTLSYIPGKKFRGKVSYIYPFLDPKTRTVKVRLEFENENMELKPGMYANVSILCGAKEETNVVPGEAVIRSGAREVVFVDVGDGKYVLRNITLGIQGEEGYFQVLEGLEEGDKIVVSGQFLLDSESSLREAVARRLRALDSAVEEKSADENHDEMKMDMPVEQEADKPHEQMKHKQ